MATNMDFHSLEAKTYKYINHPNGAIMWFDSHLGLWSKVPRSHGSDICRITLEEVKNERDLDGLGFRTRNTIVVGVPREVFRRLRKELYGRDLRADPIRFEFQIDGQRSLQAFSIDGEPVRARNDRASAIAPTSPELDDSPVAATG